MRETPTNSDVVNNSDGQSVQAGSTGQASAGDSKEAATTGVIAEQTAATEPSITFDSDALRLSVESYSSDVLSLAIQHLEESKINLADNPTAIGFTAAELSGMEIGNPFTIYVFDTGTKLVSSDNIVFPLIYNKNIIGVMEVSYDTASGGYSFTVGKAYGDELNSLRGQYDTDESIVICSTRDKLLATNGEETTILIDRAFEDSFPISEEQINSSASDIVEESSSNYSDITTPISETSLAISDGMQMEAARAFTNPLEVPHVEQTGVCGIAAWAAVLNFRFDESYTNDSLATAMIDAGYISTADDLPTLVDYKKFTNETYSGAKVVTARCPSFTTLVKTINAGKPIMGSWNSGSGSSKLVHAIIIRGFKKYTSSYTYFLKNPWYSYGQSTTVKDANSVTYSNEGVTWTLTDTVY
jgi:hypothetical protein